MTTARDIVTRAMRRLTVLEANQDPDATEMRDGLDALNSMLHDWAMEGMDVAHQDFTANSDFTIWIPPKWNVSDIASEQRLSKSLSAQIYKGEWDANANTPALASTGSTAGDLYKVSTAGTTTLSTISAWAVDDWLMFDGTNWLKGRAPSQMESAVIALLGVRMAGDFGKEPTQILYRDSEAGMRRLEAAFTAAPLVQWETGIVKMSSRRMTEF